MNRCGPSTLSFLICVTEMKTQETQPRSNTQCFSLDRQPNTSTDVRYQVTSPKTVTKPRVEGRQRTVRQPTLHSLSKRFASELHEHHHITKCHFIRNDGFRILAVFLNVFRIWRGELLAFTLTRSRFTWTAKTSRRSSLPSSRTLSTATNLRVVSPKNLPKSFSLLWVIRPLRVLSHTFLFFRVGRKDAFSQRGSRRAKTASSYAPTSEETPRRLSAFLRGNESEASGQGRETHTR